MGLLDAIDKLFEPITKKIFATEFGKNIKIMDNEELKKDSIYNDPCFNYLSSDRYNNTSDE